MASSNMVKFNIAVITTHDTNKAFGPAPAVWLHSFAPAE